MLFLLSQVDPPFIDSPQRHDRSMFPMPWFLWSPFGIFGTIFTVWMLVECLRKDPDKGTWMWIILVFPGFGPLAFFFVRWLPANNFRAPTFLRKWFKGREIHRLEAAVARIGNPYHHIQLGDALRDIGQVERAGTSYAAALAKEPANIQALWGAALVDIEKKSFDLALERLTKLMEIDPQYKFGDVSLAYGRTLSELQRIDKSIAHMEKHVKRWRHPEGLYLLATMYVHQKRPQDARAQLEAMLMDIAATPRAIARRQTIWRSKAKRLLRKLPASHPA